MITLTAGALGAIIGLFAPLIAVALTNRGSTKDGQRQVANEILNLLCDSMPLDELLAGRHSAARRRLYILGVRLRDKTARDVCAELVVAAGREGAIEDDIYPAWLKTIQEVSRIFRG